MYLGDLIASKGGEVEIVDQCPSKVGDAQTKAKAEQPINVAES